MIKLTIMEEEKDYTYEDLIQLVQDKKMTMVQFIETLPEYHPDWEKWLKDNQREKNNQAAADYLEWLEQDLYVS